METTIEEQMARQNSAVAQCATAQAMRDADRARRDAMRMQQNMTHAAEQASLGPMALEMNLPSDLDQRINAALASRMAASNVKLQVLADKLRQSSVRIDNLDIPIVEVTDDGGPVIDVTDDGGVQPRTRTCPLQCQQQDLAAAATIIITSSEALLLLARVVVGIHVYELHRRHPVDLNHGSPLAMA
jgi:hypothetical protein